MTDLRVLSSIRTLYEDRPFECPFEKCYYAAKRKDHLEVHMRQHTGDCPFKCDQCSDGTHLHSDFLDVSDGFCPGLLVLDDSSNFTFRGVLVNSMFYDRKLCLNHLSDSTLPG